MSPDAFIAESSLLRAVQAAADDVPRAALHEAAARVVIYTATSRVEASAKEALAAMARGDMLRTLLAALRRWLKSTPADLVSARQTYLGIRDDSHDDIDDLSERAQDEQLAWFRKAKARCRTSSRLCARILSSSSPIRTKGARATSRRRATT